MNWENRTFEIIFGKQRKNNTIRYLHISKVRRPVDFWCIRPFSIIVCEPNIYLTT